jgi:excisionase family DNA binding protein
MISNDRPTSSAEFPCLLWSDRQIAAAIGMSVKRVQELARNGSLPGFKLGKTWRFDPDEVRTWVKRNGGSKKVNAAAPHE